MAENPYQSPQAELQLTTRTAWSIPAVRRATRIAWLCFFLISGIGGMVLGAVVGGALGAGMAASGASMEQIQATTFLAGLGIGIPISYIVFVWSVRRFVFPAISSKSGGA